MANFTEHYQLHQWEPEDNFLREDFNEDLKKIDSAIKGVETGAAQALSQYQTANDAAVAALESGTNATLAALAANLGSGGKNARIAWGSYAANGTYGSNHPVSISFDFYPYLIAVGSTKYGDRSESPTVLIRGCTTSHSNQGGKIYITWSDRSVSWYGTESGEGQNNAYNTSYYYVVLGYDEQAESV